MKYVCANKGGIFFFDHVNVIRTERSDLKAKQSTQVLSQF